MPWRPLRRIIFGLAIHPFVPTQQDDLPLQVGDEVYIIEQGGSKGEWFRGYLVAPPSLLAGLTDSDILSPIGDGKPTRRHPAPLEARVYSGIFPGCCVQLKEAWGGSDSTGFLASQGLEHDDDVWDVHELTHWPGEGGIPSRLDGDAPHPAPIPLLKIGDETTGQFASVSPHGDVGSKQDRSASPAVVDEVSACIREWHSTRLHRLVLSREYGEVERLSGRIVRLDGARRQLLRGVLTHQERTRLGQGVIREIRRGGGVVRIGFEEQGGEVPMLKGIANWERQSNSASETKSRASKDGSGVTSAAPLATIASLAASSRLDEATWKDLSEPIGEVLLDDGGDPLDEHTPRHILMDASATVSEFPLGQDGDIDVPPITMLIYLAVEGTSNNDSDLADRHLTIITEAHAVDLSSRDSHGTISEASLRTLFSGLTSADLGEADFSAQQTTSNISHHSLTSAMLAGQTKKGVYLVVKVLANEPVKGPDVRDSISSSPLPNVVNPGQSNPVGGIKPSVIGSIKGGRRSLMWGRRHGNLSSSFGVLSNNSGSSTVSNSRPGTDESQALASQLGNSQGAIPRRDKTVRRLLAAGTLYLSPGTLLSSTDQHFSMPLFQAWSSLQEDGVDQSGWDVRFLPKTLPSRTGKYKRMKSVPELKLTVRRFVHHDSQRLVREKPTVLYRVGLTKRVGAPPSYHLPTIPVGDNLKASMSKTMTDSQSNSAFRQNSIGGDLFLSIQGLLMSRASVLAHPKTGTSPTPSSGFQGRNVQLTLEVRRGSGTRIENCIFPSANSAGTTAWRTMAIGAPESWDVMIRVSMSSADMRGGHIVMSVADAPGFPFALGWMPLWEDGAAIRNGKHELVLYSYDEHTSSMIQGRGAYLGLPWDRPRAGKQFLPLAMLPNVEFAGLEVRTAVGPASGDIVSERGVQTVLDLESNIERMTRRDIVLILRQFEFDSEQTIVSALYTVLDRLLWVANYDFPETSAGENSEQPLTLVELHDALLDALCKVLLITQDRRFNLSRQLEMFISSRPAPPARTAVVFLTALQRALSRVVDDPTDLKAGRRAREKIKSGSWLLKIMGGRPATEIYNNVNLANGTLVADAVRHSISSLFSTIRQLLRSPPVATVLMTQTVLVQQLHSWLNAVSSTLTVREVWMLSRSVIEASSGAGGVLAVWRLLLVRQVIRTLKQLYTDSSSSDTMPNPLDEELVRTVINWVGDCWGERGLILSEARSSARTGSADMTVNSSELQSAESSSVNGQFEAQVRLCAAIVADLADHLSSAADVLPGLVESYCLLETAGSFSVLADVPHESPPPEATNPDIQASEPDSLITFDLDSESPEHIFSEKKWPPVELFPIAYSFPIASTVSSPCPALPELGALFAKLCSRSIPFAHVQVEDDSELQASPDTPNLADTLSKALHMIVSMIGPKICPSSWLAVRSVFHRAAATGLSSVFHILTDAFLPAPEDAASFSTDLWRTFLNAVLSLGSSELLALEASPEQQRRAVWQIAGDVRAQIADLLISSWDALGWPTSTQHTQIGIRTLGGFQVQYVPSLVGPVAGLAIGVHGKLRRAAIHILRSMVLSEWALAEDLSVVEAALADGLASAVSRGSDRIAPRGVVVSDLQDSFGIVVGENQDLAAASQRLVALMEELLSLLAAVHSADEAAVPGALRLLELARLLGRDGLFVRYAHRLARLHCTAGHFAEAGLALRLHADLYNWDSVSAPALDFPRLPAELSYVRKERLYRAAIGLFEKAAAWENALDGYGELSSQYEHGMFDFGKLARAQRAMASIHEAIGSGRRATPRFFRAAFRGLGWSTEFRNRQYIFEASPDERAAGVATRLQTQYPACSIVGSDARASDGEGQYLVLAPVSVHRDVSLPVFMRPRVGPAVREFISAGRPREFSVSVRRAGAVVAKLVFVTAEAFPTILRRSEIVDVRTQPISQIGHAVETVTRRTAELSVLFRRASGEVLLGAGELPHSRPEAASALLTRIERLVDPQDELSCVSERELLRLPSSILNGDPAADTFDGGRDSEPLGSSPAAPFDLRPALRTVLLDHVLMLRRAISDLPMLSAPANPEVQTRLSERFHQVWAPELDALESPGSPTDGYDRFTTSPPLSDLPPSGGDEMHGLTEIMTRLTTTASSSQAGHDMSPGVILHHGSKQPKPSTGTLKRFSLPFRKLSGIDHRTSVARHSIQKPSLSSSIRDNLEVHPIQPSFLDHRTLPTSNTFQHQVSSDNLNSNSRVRTRHSRPYQQDILPSSQDTELLSALGSSGFEFDLDLDLDLDMPPDKTSRAPSRFTRSSLMRFGGHGPDSYDGQPDHPIMHELPTSHSRS